MGIDASQIWVDQLRRQVNKQKGGQAKAELVSVIATGKHAEVNWADEESVLAENPYLNEEQVSAVVKIRNKQCADELIHVKDCRVAVVTSELGWLVYGSLVYRIRAYRTYRFHRLLHLDSI